jgi:regulator of RNase E activity RraA
VTESANILDRYRPMYSSLVSDCVEALGYDARAAREGLVPFHTDTLRVAVGYAHPAQVVATSQRVEIDKLLELVETTPPDSMIVVAADQDVHGALWGGLMSKGVSQKGALGAVVDSGVRDLHQIVPMDFPVWAEYRSPLDIRGRAEMVAVGEPVTFRGVPVRPADLVFADANGVVVVPAEAIVGVLELCEERVQREKATEAELGEGKAVTEVYARYGAI